VPNFESALGLNHGAIKGEWIQAHHSWCLIQEQDLTKQDLLIIEVAVPKLTDTAVARILDEG
jgi:hypothetical protein